MQHNYRYVKLVTKHGEVGYAVVSFEWQKLGVVDKVGQTRLSFVAGVSFCSPRDKFTKKKGRIIADGRLQKNGSSVSYPRTCSPSHFVTNDDFAAVFPDIVMSSPKAPRWAKAAALSKRFSLGLKEAPAKKQHNTPKSSFTYSISEIDVPFSGLHSALYDDFGQERITTNQNKEDYVSPESYDSSRG